MERKLSGFHSVTHSDQRKTKLIAQEPACYWKAIRDGKMLLMISGCIGFEKIGRVKIAWRNLNQSAYSGRMA